jgi:hypothetical protein
MSRAVFDRRLVCKVESLSYDFTSRAGVLRMPDQNCCDMGATVKLFTGIDPDVMIIRTFSGERPDTEYHLTASGWEAFMPGG